MSRVAIAFLLGALGVCMQAPSAHAHASLRSSDPASGARLDQVPEVVSITWTEEPERSLSRIEVLDATGAPVHRGAAIGVPGDRMTMRVAVRNDLSAGVYTVSWRALSKVDGHVTGGAFVFGMGVAPTGQPVVRASASEDPAPSPLEVAARWALFVGLGLVIGAARVGVLTFIAPPVGIRRMTAAGWVVATIGLVAFAEAQRRAAGTDYGVLLDVSLGRALLWRAAAIALVGAALLAARRTRTALPVAGGAAAGAMLAHVSAGHAGAGGGAASVAGQWVHVVAASVWLGGLAALLTGIRTTSGPDVARAIRRFSTVAGVALLVVLGTGVVRALDELPGWGDLFSSWYGRVVLVKLGLLVALAVLGAVNRYRNVPRGEEGVAGLRRVARPEVALAALALLAAAVLATLSPPSGDAVTPAAAASLVATGSDFAATVRVRLEVEPGFPGLNAFRARVTGFDDGRPVEASAVRLIFTFLDDRSIGESELRLAPAGDGLYRADGDNLSLDGRWQVVALVQTTTDATEIPLRVATRCRVQATPVPGQPTLYDVRLPGGRTAQGYVAPGEAGSNEVHVTFFDRDGTELAVKRSPRMTATPQGGEVETLSIRRLGPGHFVADAALRTGAYRFDVAAALPGEEHASRTCFEEAIRP